MRLGVCYYPEHWPEDRWPTDAAMMREAGISRVRIGEFAWSRIEPTAGAFDWAWLDRAIDTLHREGLGVILGTPTATPPKWLVDTMPDMFAVDRSGSPRKFGSRRHYCFSHAEYRAECARITRAMAERYGQHPAIVAWQTDNEYGCHDTVQSFSASARGAFRYWLADRYQDIAALNDAWGNVFWSMEYRSFDEIELPNLTVTEANPANWLAFRRFSSDQVVSFNRVQIDILRRHSPGRDIMHNAMGFYTGYDHFDLAEDLDCLGWDSYPLGFLETFRFREEDKHRYARTGHPDIAGFHHDLYRGCAKDGRWCVLEQQPGPVNWARHNPAPLPGMVNLWTAEAAAHGAELVSYFRWRQAPFAQEQMHAGLLRPDGQPATALAEISGILDELPTPEVTGQREKQAAILFDYAAEWMTQIQPQGADLSALWAAFSCYEELRVLGLNVDFVRPGEKLDSYRLAVVPCLPIVTDAAAASLRDFAGQIVVGPRTGSRDADFRIPDALAPGPLVDLLGITVTKSESLRPGLTHQGEGWEIAHWLDHVEGPALPDMVADDGTAACWRLGNARYCATWPEGAVIAQILQDAAADAKLELRHLANGLRRVTYERGTFWFNYGPGTAATDTGSLKPANWRYEPKSGA